MAAFVGCCVASYFAGWYVTEHREQLRTQAVAFIARRARRH